MTTIPIDYEILRLVWWLLLGVLLIGFAIMDGFDLGVAMLLPFVARTDIERRVMINAVGPFWDGNQVWLILGGGAIFAAWPPVYAASFSGFYIAMFLVLATLILRPVGFEFRNKVADTRWRSFWDYALFAGGLVPSVVFGVAFGNLLQGVPFRIDSDLRIFYEGSGLFELLNPFGLLCGLVSAAMLATHGAAYLTLKTDGAVRKGAQQLIGTGATVTIALFLLAGLWVWIGIDGYAITSTVTGAGPSNPLLKTVSRQPGQWFANYAAHPWMILAPCMGIAGPVLTLLLTRLRRSGLAFTASALGIFGIVATAGVSMFPFLMPSNIAPMASLTVWGRVVEPAHIVRDAARDPDLPADCSLLYCSRLRGAARFGDRKRHRAQLFRFLLRKHNVVLHMDSRCRVCQCFRHSQRRVARASPTKRSDRRLGALKPNSHGG